MAVVEHPAERRFEAADGQVRALYGHSFAVNGLDSIDQEVPPVLFHGTTWEAISAITTDGLLPMRRQAVHLTNDEGEALAVARRHGARQILLSVTTEGLAELRAATVGVWAVSAVDARRLQIVNVHDQDRG